MSDSPFASLLKSLRHPFSIRVRPLALVCTLFVVILIGLMLINNQRGKLDALTVRSVALNQERDEEVHKRDLLNYQVLNSTSDEFIINTARTRYNYMMPGELLFIVKNPEAFEDGGDVEIYVVEGET